MFGGILPPNGSAGVSDADVTAAVNAAVTTLVDGAPGALDKLNELAAAIGDDADFVGTMTTALAGKEPTQTAASQGEMEAGTEAAIRSMSPLRVAQAIDALGVGGGGGGADIQTFTENGTWTKPTCSLVRVILIGGGGPGGSGKRGAAALNRFGGGGGSGAGMIDTGFVPASFFDATESVVVGVGGVGGASVTVNDTSGNPGVVGTASTFSNYNAPAGGPGSAGTGSGGTGGSTVGVVLISGSYATSTASELGQAANGGSTNGASPTQPTRIVPMGGGGGGGVSNSDVVGTGGNGCTLSTSISYGFPNRPTYAQGGQTDGASGANGSNGSAADLLTGWGGAGGAGGKTANAGSGGNGGLYGGGGGGGGGSLNGFNSGAGGNGGSGIVIVISI